MSVWHLLRSVEMVKDIDIFVRCSMYDIWKYGKYDD